jgi:hypothetical protein
MTNPPLNLARTLLPCPPNTHTLAPSRPRRVPAAPGWSPPSPAHSLRPRRTLSSRVSGYAGPRRSAMTAKSTFSGGRREAAQAARRAPVPPAAAGERDAATQRPRGAPPGLPASPPPRLPPTPGPTRRLLVSRAQPTSSPPKPAPAPAPAPRRPVV